MQKRMVAILATVCLVLGLGFGSALAAQDGAGEAQQSDKCERSDGKAKGCENHPGGGDDEEDPGEGPFCADLAQIDQALADACDELTGGGDPGDPGEGPSCEQLPDPALVAACTDVTGNLPA